MKQAFAALRKRFLRKITPRAVLAVIGFLFMVLLAGNYIAGLLRGPGPGYEGKIKLAVSSAALPEGVGARNVSATVSNIFELDESVRSAAGGDIVMAAVRLEPSGITLTESMVFSMTVFATHEFTPRVLNVSDRGVEEIPDLTVAFNGEKEELTITGLVSHFSELAATKTESEETAREFVQRRKEEADWLKQQAERETFWSEKAKRYRELADKAIEWQREGLERFEGTPGETDLPQLGGNAYHSSHALEQYARTMERDYLGQLELTKDPHRRFQLLQEWTEKQMSVAAEWTSGAWDERRTYPQLGKMGKLSRALGDSPRGIEIDIGKGTKVPGLDVLADLFRKTRDYDIEIIWFEHDPEQGSVLVVGRAPGSGIAKKIFEELDARIRQEADPLERFELLKDRMEKTHWVIRTTNGGAFDERVIPGIGRNSLRESSILQEQSVAIIQEIRELIENEQDPAAKRKLAQQLLDITDWLRGEWGGGAHDTRLTPDMSDWPVSIDDILGGPALPAGPELPAGTKPRTSTEPKPAAGEKCDFDGFLRCRDQFNLQGCIDGCPFVPTACPADVPSDTECQETDQGCSDDCWNQGNAHGSECAAQYHCTMQEIEERLRGQ